ncbi:hypothetical protein NC651_022555 [Populus alba x Populus x berolinensis]|nr:hypothetical protein NC651_022555 [Populus alba x Populus x berolinensis]
MDKVSESMVRSYGVLTNSFLELEPAYSEHYKMEIKRKTWHIGPLSLCNRDMKDKADRGNVSSIHEHECMRWLAKKSLNSVLYICFGSFFNLSAAQLQGFEKRMEGKGLIVSGWAPQVLILDHKAVGGFMTHCGWNSTLEGVTAGVPMVTWPLGAEQFCNKKLITDVLKIGIGVGALEWSRYEKKIIVRKEDIEKAIIQLMVGEEAEEIRNRARVLKEMARRATKGGSSYSDLTAFLEEL